MTESNTVCTDCEAPFYDALGYSTCAHCRRCDAIDQKKERQRDAIQHWDDERDIGNGIIVTLKPGNYFYDDCGVQGFDTPQEAMAAVAKAVR